MAQYIKIKSRAGNNRIERAIPEFMSRFGMELDQATAVAIRLESVGKLTTSGEPLTPAERSTRGTGSMLSVSAGLALAQRLMQRPPDNPQTTIQTSTNNIYTDPFIAANAIRQGAKVVSSNRLRQRVTRGR